MARSEPAPPLVAIIDSGVARTPELADSLVAEYDMATSTPRPAFLPRYAHGTMVATILRRQARRPIEIVSLRIDDPAGCPAKRTPPCQPRAEPIAQAILKATELGATVINMSLSLKDDPQIIDAVRKAGERGVMVVMAAGNEGRDRPSNTAAARAAFPCAVIVGALDPEGKPWTGSNHPVGLQSDYLFEWQRGVSIPTALDDGTEVFATGTSMATPIEVARLLDESVPASGVSRSARCRQNRAWTVREDASPATVG